jgi:hypothetical protein
MYFYSKGIINIVCRNRSKIILAKELYIPKLQVSRDAGLQIYKVGYTDCFTKLHIYLTYRKNKIII